MARPYLAETISGEGPLTRWGVVRSADGSVVIQSKAWGRDAAEAVALRLNATHAEATAIERARIRPILERCENLAEGVRFNHPEEWRKNNLAPLLADLRRELGREG